MNITVSCAHTGISLEKIKQDSNVLKPEIIQIQQALDAQNYDSVYASLYLVQDDAYVQKITMLVEEKKRLHPTILVIIGIGGSNLGTLALQEALLGKLYNEKNPALKVYYVDTVDTNYSGDILHLMRQELEQHSAVLINIVTKSGITTETIANAEVFIKLLMHYHPNDYARFVVITTDKDSILWNIAQKEHFACLEIPKKVGGRYSVFSAVGLFPLGLLGANIDQLRAGAASMIKQCTSSNIDENSALQTAITLYTQYTQAIYIQDMFLFCVQLEGIGKWYRQLMGESLGKEFNVRGQKVEIGITPTVSMGTVDLHSVGQLYLGGPRDKSTTFISVKEQKQKLVIPIMDQFEQAVEKIQGKSFEMIMEAILRGVQAAYIKSNRPFITIELPECNEYYLGQLLQYKMIEMIYLGYLLEVNPFDQPNVELYKQETRKILAS